MLIKVHVKCLSTRQEACVEIDDVQPGSALKSRVEQQFQVNVAQQKLMKGGRAIADAMTLRSQGIGNNDRLTLIVAKSAAPVASAQPSALTMSDTLRTELLAHLRPHFTHDSCTMIIHKLDQIMNRYVHDISLDDIEALASKRHSRAAGV